MNNKTGQRVEKDTFLSLYDYSHHIEAIFLYFKEMGLAIVDLWQQSAVLNDQRVDSIRRAFLEYFAMMEVNYGNRSTEAYAEAKTILNDLKARDITDQLFSFKNILVEEEMGIMASKIGKRPASYDVKTYH